MLTVFALSLCAILYVFSDGSMEAVRDDVVVADIVESPLVNYIGSARRGANLLDALNENKQVSNIQTKIITFESLLGDNTLPQRLYSFGVTGKADLERFEIVRVSFVYNNADKIHADFLVLKGQMFGFLDKKYKDFVAPWARVVSIVNVSRE